VVSKQDPGAPNWLDTCGRPRGTIFLRWQGVTGPAPQQPSAKVVKVAEVRRELPDGEPVVTEQERRRSISERSEAINRRYSI
jgi:hypothetical protein